MLLPQKPLWITRRAYKYISLIRRLHGRSSQLKRYLIGDKPKRFLLPQTAKLSRLRIVVSRTINNVFLTAVNFATNKVIASVSAGSCGLRGSRKTSNVAAERTAVTLVNQLLLKNIKRVDVVVTTPIVDAFVKTILRNFVSISRRRFVRRNFGNSFVAYNRLKVTNILFSVAKTHNGIRLRKVRRV